MCDVRNVTLCTLNLDTAVSSYITERNGLTVGVLFVCVQSQSVV